MDYEKVRIPYQGRREFGTEGSDGVSLAHSIISQYFGGVGGAGTETGGNGSGYGGDENRGGNAKSFNAWLSKNSKTFNELELEGSPFGITDVVYVMGYRDMEPAQTLIGDINFSAETSANTYDIQGLVEGISVVVSGNGTNGTILYITADQRLQSGGTLTIPVAVNINDNPLDPYQYIWWQNPNKVKLIYLTYTWALDKGGSSNYFMDLSNQTAYVNCDSGGNMYSASIMTLTCSATTSIGTTEIHPYYDIFTLPIYNATGFGIDQNGVMYFNYSAGTIFNFQGNTLPINVRAWEHQGDETPIAKKTMTIYKNLPGVSGADAVSHWIVTSVNQIKYNPNTNTFTPSAITATCWKQVGYHEPEIDSATTIWFWRSTYPTPTEYTGGTPIVVTAYTEETSYTFGLKNTNGDFYELEDVLVMRDGLSGTTGPQGPQGDSGKSAWYVSLDNQNCSINADSDGNILSGAVHPTCVAKVYYGSKRMTTGFSWVIDTPDLGDNMIIEHWGTPSAGCVTFETTSALTFSAESIQISIGIKVSGENVDTKIWNITKSIAGADGQTSKTYWLALNATEVSYDPNTDIISPSSISAVSYMQEGQLPPGVSSAETHIEMSKIIRGSGAEQGYNQYTMRSLIGINSYSAETYSGFRFKLYKGDAQVDQQDVLILKDGEDGTNGRDGAAIRGPYDYYAVSSSTQCWCAGSGTTQCGECGDWIDVVYKDGVYYRCIKSYQGKCTSGITNAASGISNSEYWTSGENYDFIATNLLLAENAKIKFLSNNQLYLMSGGNVTAGAAGGNGISFWAGWPEPSSAAPFSVSADGNLIATKGTIAGWNLTNSGYSYTGGAGEDYLHSAINHDGIEFDATPAGGNQHFKAGLDGISFTTEIAGLTGLDLEGDGMKVILSDGEGAISTENMSAGVHTNMDIYGYSNVLGDEDDGISVKTPVFVGDDIYKVNYSANSNTVVGWQTAVMSPFFSKLKIAIVTSGSSYSSYFTKVTVGNQKKWYFNTDMDTNIVSDYYDTSWHSTGYDYIVQGQQSWVVANYKDGYAGISSDMVGMWLACTTSSPSASSYFKPTGIYGPSLNNRKGDTLYFEV